MLHHYKNTRRFRLLVFLFLVCLAGNANAQKKQSKRSLKAISSPEKAEEILVPKEVEILDEKDWERLMRDNLASSIEEFLRQLPLMAEIPKAPIYKEPVYVTISEALQIDCVWVTTHEYFGVWDSQKLNPYNEDVEKLSDTLALRLYDEMIGENWSSPVKDFKRVSSPFGFRRFRWHYGIDLSLNTGDTVYAAFDGIVRIKQYDRNGYGNYVVLIHKNGLESLYGHFSKTLVNVGDEVKAGEPIGLGGSTGRSTGPHLHFETRYMGQAFDPTEVFDFETYSIKLEEFLMHAGVFSYLGEARKTVYHTVRSGDNLGKISQRYGVSIAKITSLNGITRNSILRVGQRLRIN